MEKMKLWYCDIKVVSTVTLQTLAESEEEAREKFQNGKYLIFDTVTPVREAKEFGELRNTSNWQDPDEEEKGE